MIIRCRICHRVLHNPESQIEGVGPVCGHRDNRQIRMFPDMVTRYKYAMIEDDGQIYFDFTENVVDEK